MLGALLAFILLATGAAPASMAAAAQAKPQQVTWLTVLLDGRKIGHAQFTRSSADHRVTTRQDIHLQLNRNGQTLAIHTSETDVETDTGKPLQFEALTDMSGMHNRVTGKRQANGQFEIVHVVAGNKRHSTITQPGQAMLAEGQRLRAMQAARKPGTEFTFQAWDVLSGRALPTRNSIVGQQKVSLPGGTQQLLRIDQSTQLSQGRVATTLWLGSDYRIRRMRTSMLGMTLELLACSKACAMAPDQGVDILDQSMVALPHALPARARRAPLLYSFQAVDGASLSFASTAQQRVQKTDADTWQVRVSTTPQGHEAPPKAADRQANDWLQSDNPELRKVARSAVADAHADSARMQRLQRFVAGYITRKNLSVGYASALQVLHDREGDCTEHAVLLAALGRALGIPTRVVTGLAYVGHYAGREHVLVPHAWVQAWVDGHWRGYDAALRGFDTGHVALGVGDGDPWHFYDAVSALGRIQVTGVSPANPAATQPGG